MQGKFITYRQLTHPLKLGEVQIFGNNGNKSKVDS
jgi:hypothetical protein